MLYVTTKCTCDHIIVYRNHTFVAKCRNTSCYLCGKLVDYVCSLIRNPDEKIGAELSISFNIWRRGFIIDIIYDKNNE